MAFFKKITRPFSLSLLLLGGLLVATETTLWLTSPTPGPPKVVDQTATSFPRPGEVFKIICLGETATYPTQLQNLLNQRFPQQKWKVQNAGVPSVNSDFLLENITSLAEKERPQMIVAMMGVNDKWAQHEERPLPGNFLSSSRTGKLLLSFFPPPVAQPIPQQASPTILPSQRLPMEKPHILKLAQNFFQKENFPEAKKHYRLWFSAQKNPLHLEPELRHFFQFAWKQNFRDYSWPEEFSRLTLSLFPGHYLGHRFLGEFYISRLKSQPSSKNQMDLELGKDHWEKARGLQDRSSEVYLNLSELYLMNQEVEKAREIIQEAITYTPFNSVWYWYEAMNIFYSGGEKEVAASIGRKALEYFPENVVLNEFFRRHFSWTSTLKNSLCPAISAFCSENVPIPLMEAFHPQTEKTLENFQKLAQLARERKIFLLAMQYPLEKITRMEKALQNFPEVALLEQRENRGDRMIAENIVAVMEKRFSKMDSVHLNMAKNKRGGSP